MGIIKGGAGSKTVLKQGIILIYTLKINRFYNNSLPRSSADTVSKIITKQINIILKNITE